MAEMTAEQTGLITEDQLMALGSSAHIEIIDGKVVEVSPVGIQHHLIVANIQRALDQYVRAHQIGFVFPDGLIYLLSKEGQHLKGARVPDVSYVRKIDKAWDIERPYPGAPTLAVEVMSPEDKAEDMPTRVADYLNAGSDEVWVVYPAAKEVHQFRRADRALVRVFAGDTSIDTSALFPDLTIRLSEVFALPDFGNG